MPEFLRFLIVCITIGYSIRAGCAFVSGFGLDHTIILDGVIFRGIIGDEARPFVAEHIEHIIGDNLLRGRVKIRIQFQVFSDVSGNWTVSV